MTYTYNYLTAEGSYVDPSYTETSLRRARKSARSLAVGNCLAGSTATWQVIDAEGDTVASGTVRNNRS